MTNFEEIYNKHYGETGLIVCSGPSLRNVPLDFLNRHTSFAFNNIFVLEEFAPTYYVASNSLAIDNNWANIEKLSIPKFITEGHGITNAYDMRVIPHPNMFSLDLCWGVHEGHTVTHVTLQIAYYMGFKTILIVGCDHRFIYDGPEDSVAFMEGEDPNHFHPDYMKNRHWHTPNLEESAKAYVVDRRYYESAGRRIINLTEGTALDVFEKDDIKNW